MASLVESPGVVDDNMATEGAGRDIAMVICAVVDESFFIRFRLFGDGGQPRRGGVSR
jgi:hypothetical protein